MTLRGLVLLLGAVLILRSACLCAEMSRTPTAVAASIAAISALLTCSPGGAEVAVPPVSAALEAVLQRLDARVHAVYQGLPPNALLIVATGHGDTPAVRK